MTGANFSSWFNNSEGTVYWDRSRTAPGTNPELTIFNSNVATGFYFGSIAYLNTPSSGTISVFGLTNSVLQVDMVTGSGLTGTSSIRTAYAYRTNDFAGSSNGATVTTDLSGTLQPGVNSLNMCAGGGTNSFAYIRKFAYYPVRLTNSQLQNLSL